MPSLKTALSSIALITCMSYSPCHAGLVINMDYTAFDSSAPANVSTIFNGGTLAQAKAVMNTAVDYWEAAFANSDSSIGWSSNNNGTLTQNISVGWDAHDGNTLATGGTSFFGDGRWSSGSLDWDNDGTSTFFVDDTPMDNGEWRQQSQRSLNLGGVDINVEQVHFDAPAGTARDNSDMLSVAIHEIGHALGFLGTAYSPFAASDIGGDGDIDVVGGQYDGAQIAYSGGHTSFQMDTPSTEYPYDPDNPLAFFPINSNHYPNNLAPVISTGTRKLLSDADLAAVASVLQFDQSTINFNSSVTPVPEPTSLIMVGLAGLRIAYRRRR